MNKIAYLTNTRFPTEKAHGLQICKTCEAFAEHGIEVLLYHPERKLTDADLPHRDLLNFYGIKTGFKIKRLYNPDIFRLEHILPKKIFPYFYIIHAFLWSMFAVLTAKNEKADLYYTRDITIALWLSLFGMPAVFEAHASPGFLQRKLLPFISRKPAFKAVILMAAFLKPIYERIGILPNKIILSHHGFSPDMFAHVQSREKCRKKLGLPLENKLIGYIGRFKSVESDKGIKNLIEMMSFLNTGDISPPLLMCVGGPLNTVPGYILYAQQKNIPEKQLLFFDHVPNSEVPLWICACDAVILPLSPAFMTDIGALPLKLFEYMASGIPIVATDLASLKEFLRNNENAILVKPENPSAMAKGLEKIVSSPETGNRLAAQAKKDIHQYTWKFRAEKILKSLNFKY